MSKMIQIRNVPDGVHRTLKARAAHAGMSLSEFLLQEIADLAARPSFDEWITAVGTDGRVRVSESSAEAVRAERDAR
jgi:antitoxin FitA